MDLPLNTSSPRIMHVDINSCFATIEQQANPLLRGKPVVVAAYTTDRGCVLTPSIEAKRYGIKTGMYVKDAKLLYPGVIVLPPDPVKYRTIHLLLRNLLECYTLLVVPKSIDEFVLDFSLLPNVSNIENIGYEIKQRIKKEVGDWIFVNIGIGPSRFLAKTAASLHKPDGLDVISHANVRNVYASLSLIDINGINTHYQVRLNAAGIFTPLEFLDAPLVLLEKQVFKSICGYYWYRRLRGWENDDVEFTRRSYGQSYALPKQTSDPKVLSAILMKLCEKMGRRLRRAGYAAEGVHVYCSYKDGDHWGMGKVFHRTLYATRDFYLKAQFLLNEQPEKKPVRNLAVSSFELVRGREEQMELFEDRHSWNNLTDATDRINDRFGEFTIIPARMMNMDHMVVDRIAFGRAGIETPAT